MPLLDILYSQAKPQELGMNNSYIFLIPWIILNITGYFQGFLLVAFHIPMVTP